VRSGREPCAGGARRPELASACLAETVSQSAHNIPRATTYSLYAPELGTLRYVPASGSQIKEKYNTWSDPRGAWKPPTVRCFIEPSLVGSLRTMPYLSMSRSRSSGSCRPALRPLRIVSR